MSFSDVMSVVRPVFVVLGVLIAVTGIVTTVAGRRRRRTWTPAAGRVVASRLDGDGHHRLQVAFVHEGQEVRFWNRFTSTRGGDAVGRDVELLVNPADPADAVVTRGAPGARSVGPTLVLVGLVAALIGAFAPS